MRAKLDGTHMYSNHAMVTDGEVLAGFEAVPPALAGRIADTDIAINYGYNIEMDVSIAAAKNRLPELIHAMEEGENIIITRHGKPVAQLAPPPPERDRPVRLGGMKERIRLLPGWDAPIDPERFLAGDL